MPESNIDKYRFYQIAQYCDACDYTTGNFVGVDGILMVLLEVNLEILLQPHERIN